MRMIFVNLPVKDMASTRRFFSALGFTFNEQFSDEQAACMVVSAAIFVMLMVEARFQAFFNGKVGDPEKDTQVLTCMSAESRAEVDDFKAKALAAGAREWKPNIEFGPL